MNYFSKYCIRFIYVIFILFNNTLFSQNGNIAKEDDYSDFGHIIIISFDHDSIKYELFTPSLISVDEKQQNVLYSNKSTSVTKEIVFIKSKEINTLISFTHPFVKDIHFKNEFNYLYIQIKNREIKNLIFSNELRFFY
jgi:hypothetical protein